MIRFIDATEREMANGFRCCNGKPLTKSEIEELIKDIRSIEADESVFVFDHPDFKRTCYDSEDDIIYVARNVFPSDYPSFHPRDMLSPRAVLAHEYYGHRSERQRYLKEENHEIEKMEKWLDEVYVSIKAAFTTPNLLQIERAELIREAIARANEYSKVLELTEDMKEILYGEGNISPGKKFSFSRDIKLVSYLGDEGDGDDRQYNSQVPRM